MAPGLLCAHDPELLCSRPIRECARSPTKKTLLVNLHPESDNFLDIIGLRWYTLTMNVRYMASIDGSPAKGFRIKMYLDEELHRAEESDNLNDAVRIARLWARRNHFPNVDSVNDEAQVTDRPSEIRTDPPMSTQPTPDQPC